MISFAEADTTWVSAGNVSGVWTASGSPYIVSGDITLASADSLQIEAGTKIFFSGQYKFTVQGKLWALGTEQDSVVFTTDTLSNPGRWRGLRFIGPNDSSRFDYCVVEFARALGTTSSDSTGGAILIGGTTYLRLAHSTFCRNHATKTGGAIHIAPGSSVNMSDCDLLYNHSETGGGAIFFHNVVTSTINRCRLSHNISILAGGGIVCRYSHPAFDSTEFNFNSSGNDGGGLNLVGSYATFNACTVFGNIAGSHGGGAACFEEARPIFTFCVMDSNRSVLFDGGGVYCWESSPEFYNSAITRNQSHDDGGGVHCYRPLAMGIFTDCIIRGNIAGGNGAGVWCALDASPAFTRCAINGNQSGDDGGGVYMRVQSFPSFTDCSIDSNTTESNGGGMSCRTSDPTLIRCSMNYNASLASGGGLHCWDVATPFLDNCEFNYNTAGTSGGGIVCDNSSPIFTNPIVAGNTAVQSGGGLHCIGGGIPEFNHATFALNSAVTGGGLYLSSSPLRMLNSAVVYSTGNDIYFSQSDNAVFEFCAFTSAGDFSFANADITNAPDFFGQILNINANGDSCDTYANIFEDPILADTAAGNFAPGFGSPLIGAANADSVLPADYFDNARPSPALSIPDIGAIEHDSAGIPVGLWGRLSGTIGPGEFKVVSNIRVDSAESLTLAAGTSLMFCGPVSFTVLGTLTATGTIIDSIFFQTDTLLNPGRWRGLRFINSGSDDSALEYSVVRHSSAKQFNNGSGGGILFDNSDAILNFCSLSDNRATRGGAAAMRNQASPVLDDCVFFSNSADSGGAVYIETQSTPLFQSNLFFDNSASTAGGAVFTRSASGIFDDCRLLSNTSGALGGAAYGISSTTQWNNCLVINNSAVTQGGTYWMDISSPIIRNTTIAGGTAAVAGGLYVRFSTPSIRNSIITSASGSRFYFYGSSSAAVRYCDVYGATGANYEFLGNLPSQGPAGIGVLSTVNGNGDPCDTYYNIALNPLFASGPEGGYYLSQTEAGQANLSPCVDAGDPADSLIEGSTRTDHIFDLDVIDQGYHVLFGVIPAAVEDLTLYPDGDNIILRWSYPVPAAFIVYSDATSNGSFAVPVTLTTDTTVTLPATAQKLFYIVRAELQ